MTETLGSTLSKVLLSLHRTENSPSVVLRNHFRPEIFLICFLHRYKNFSQVKITKPSLIDINVQFMKYDKCPITETISQTINVLT